MKNNSQVVDIHETVESTALQKLQNSTIVIPAVSVEGAVAAWNQYEDLKKSITAPSDIQQIQGKDFLKKSYWRKCATFFNLTIDIFTEKRVVESDSTITFEVVYRATAPNGRHAIGDGACNDHEKKDRQGNLIKNSIHNARGTAHTRAFNRAVSNLVGGGEVSAEEVEGDYVNVNSLSNSAPTSSPNQEMDIPWDQEQNPQKITANQAKRLYAIIKGKNLEVKSALEPYGYTRTDDVLVSEYERICNNFLGEKK